MEKVTLSQEDIINLKELFKENYLIVKQTKEYEKRSQNNKIKLLLKEIRDTHQENLLTIMKLLDEKERII